jgi:hypothetical protein
MENAVDPRELVRISETLDELKAEPILAEIVGLKFPLSASENSSRFVALRNRDVHT